MKCDRNRIAHTKWKCKTTNWGCIYLCYPTILVVTWQQGQFKTAHSRKRSTLLTLAYVLNSYCLSSLIPWNKQKPREQSCDQVWYEQPSFMWRPLISLSPCLWTASIPLLHPPFIYLLFFTYIYKIYISPSFLHHIYIFTTP